MFKRWLHLVDGAVYELTEAAEVSYSPGSFTNGTIHKFACKDGVLIFVQGDKVSHVRIREAK